MFEALGLRGAAENRAIERHSVVLKLGIEHFIWRVHLSQSAHSVPKPAVQPHLFTLVERFRCRTVEIDLAVASVEASVGKAASEIEQQVIDHYAAAQPQRANTTQPAGDVQKFVSTPKSLSVSNEEALILAHE